MEKSAPAMRLLARNLRAIGRIAPQTSAALAGCLIYLLLSIYSGSILRNSFDDEIDTLLSIQQDSFGELLRFPVTPAHTPLPYLVFKALWTIWPSIYFLRCFSLMCSAACIYLGTRLVFDALPYRTRAGAPPWNIGAAILVIATTPLIVAQGDAIRWYPMFAAIVFFAFRYESRGKSWHSAALAGIGFSINIVGISLYVGMAACRLWKHLKKPITRTRVIADEAIYGLCFAAAGMLGLASLLIKLVEGPGPMAEHFTSPLTAIGQAPLGLIGGYALGILAGLPIVAAYGALFIYVVWRQRDGIAKLMFVLVPSLVPALIIFAGFARPRAFLFLAVACSMVLAAGVLTATAKRAFAIAGAAIVIHMLVVANRGGTVGLFKRNLAVPFAEISEFVAANLPADGALITTDDVVAYTSQEKDRLSCVALGIPTPCLGDKHSVIITVTGDQDLEGQRQILDFARSRCGREEAIIPFGIDEEAGLKSRLTGVSLSRIILTGRLFKECD
jgi:hypothetical protein